MREPQQIDIVANGIRQHALRWPGGDGAALVVMLHGCGSNAMNYLPLAQRLDAHFGDELDIVALDHRGCGLSECPATGYTPDVIAQDVLAVIDELGYERATLMGHSRGGWYSAYIAGHFPDKVDRVVLIDPARMVFATQQAADDFYDRVRRGIGPFNSLDEAIANGRRSHPTAIWTDDRLRGLQYGLREDADGKLVGRMPGWVLDQLKAARVTTDEVGPYLGAVTAPTYLLVSSQSDQTRQNEKLAYAKGITHAKVDFFDTSHYLHQDAPDEVADAIARFLVANPVLHDPATATP